MNQLNAGYSSEHPRRGFAHELVRDWRRWSKAERIAASCIPAILLVGAPALIGERGEAASLLVDPSFG